MEKFEKLKIIVLISLVIMVITGVIIFVYFLLDELPMYISIALTIISIIVIYGMGVFIGYKKGIKDILSLICLGLLISIFDLILSNIFYSISYMLGDIIDWEEVLLWEEAVQIEVVLAILLKTSKFLIVGHISSILILLFVKKSIKT